MIKIALASKNPKVIDGVKAGFEEFFFTNEVSVEEFYFGSNNRRELIEGQIFAAADRKMKSLRRTVKSDYDYFVVIEDGIFSKGGDLFYSIVATIQSFNLRGVKMVGTSANLMIPEEKITEVFDNGFQSVYSDADIQSVSKLSYSYTVLVKQATIIALISNAL